MLSHRDHHLAQRVAAARHPPPAVVVRSKRRARTSHAHAKIATDARTSDRPERGVDECTD
eukprot:1490859-Pleurochrysis_carterae.AAC.1